tara:strand:- start:152 stop:1168 length:1017 start_codon:yes stop_codon:yes gene_type:complete
MQNNYHPHGFRILNEKMILNQTMLNEQNVDGPGMNDMSPGLAKDFWDWVSNLTPADWSAITALGAAAGGFFMGPLRFLKRIWTFMSSPIWALNDINTWISNTFEIDGIMPDVNDQSPGSLWVGQMLAFIADDDYSGNEDYDLAPGDTFSMDDIATFMTWIPFLGADEVGQSYYEGNSQIEIGQVHVTANILMEALNTGAGAAGMVWLGSVIGAGSLAAAASVTIGGVAVTGGMAFCFFAAMYLIIYCLQNSLPISTVLEDLGMPGFDEMYEEYQQMHIDFYNNVDTEEPVNINPTVKPYKPDPLDQIPARPTLDVGVTRDGVRQPYEFGPYAQFGRES